MLGCIITCVVWASVEDVDRDAHSNLLQEPYETRRGHHADFPHQRLRYGPAPLLLAAAVRIGLRRE